MKMMIWDWNGTLLNDAECCFNILNNLCRARGLKCLDTVDDYRRIFGFPVSKIYEQIGIDFSKESFEEISVEYTTQYEDTYHNYGLHEHSLDLLKKNKDEGIINILLSASQIDILKKQAEVYKCDIYFDEILGLDNIYAHSKVELAKEFINNTHISADDVVWIGDSVHDYECAKECGTHCILVAQGHQPKSLLETTDAIVVDNLVEAIKRSREI